VDSLDSKRPDLAKASSLGRRFAALPAPKLRVRAAQLQDEFDRINDTDCMRQVETV